MVINAIEILAPVVGLKGLIDSIVAQASGIERSCLLRHRPVKLRKCLPVRGYALWTQDVVGNGASRGSSGRELEAYSLREGARSAKVTLQLCRCRQCCAIGIHILTYCLPFLTDEKEELILENRTTEIPAVIVEPQNLLLLSTICDASRTWGCYGTKGREVISGVECVVPNELEESTVEIVVSTAGHHVDSGPSMASVSSC